MSDVETTMNQAEDRLKRLYESELENYRVNVRNGNIDPADGFHPTLATTADSVLQAPLDIVQDWLGYPRENLTTGEWQDFALDLILFAFEVSIAPDRKLVDIVE